MKRRGERLQERGEGRLMAAALAVCLVLSLAVYFIGRPGWETLAPVHSVPDAVRRAEMVNINRASAKEISELPGIGEVLARRIVEYRERHGNFASVQELLHIDGIGEGKLAAVQGHIYIE